MNRKELAEYFNTTEGVIKTNFPKFAAKKIKEGYLITREGQGENTNYTIIKTEPQTIDKSGDFSMAKTKPYIEDLPGEKWAPCCIDYNYSVSNLGRVRYNPTQKLLSGTIRKTDGYHYTSIKHKNYSTHRIILQSFDPRENCHNLTVDHINGVRTDNRLKNLRWATNEENLFYMFKHRADLNKELTRIINKYGYNKTLEILKNI